MPVDVRRNLSAERAPPTYAIIGAAMEVHNQLGHGFWESVYQEACVVEFTSRQIPFQREVALNILCKGLTLGCQDRADFICNNAVSVELKAHERLSRVETAPAINYLKATGIRRGLLINFGAPSLQYERLVYTTPRR
jgi:GxxExxY protein